MLYVLEFILPDGRRISDTVDAAADGDRLPTWVRTFADSEAAALARHDDAVTGNAGHVVGVSVYRFRPATISVAGHLANESRYDELGTWTVAAGCPTCHRRGYHPLNLEEIQP